MIIDTITARNNNVPAMVNPKIRGQSTSSSPTVMVGFGTDNVKPNSLNSRDSMSPLIASCRAVAETGVFVLGLVTTKLKLP